MRCYRNDSRLFSFPAFLALLLFAPLVLTGCADGAGSPDSSTETVANITLKLPEGYKYDRASGAIYTTGAVQSSTGKYQGALPPYVTGMTLTISGDDMETMVLDVDLATLSVSFSITAGIRTFSLLVTTNIGLTFTDEVTVEVVTGAPLHLAFNLIINASPIISSITASATIAQPADVITLTCAATDQDPEDKLTYSWSGPDGWTAQGQEATFTIPDYGLYTFTCSVSDGWGGVVSASVTVNAPNPNQPPVILAAKVREPIMKTILSYSPVGLPVELFCSASDPDGDPLTYTWAGPMGAVPGPVYTYTPTISGNFTFTCIVSDGFNPPVKASATLLSKYETVMASDVYFTDEWQVAGAVGDSVDINCMITPPTGVKLGISLSPGFVGGFCTPPPSPVSVTGTLLWTIGVSPFMFDIYAAAPLGTNYNCVMKSMQPTAATMTANNSFCSF
ncbi:MAG: PKD domain-containing protein [Nitrospinota bacterium]|nr:PKD domain-containing protein [Nitrospinota bacterium]